jgi:lipopolysaccharide heptosyltransferase II
LLASSQVCYGMVGVRRVRFLIQVVGYNSIMADERASSEQNIQQARADLDVPSEHEDTAPAGVEPGYETGLTLRRRLLNRPTRLLIRQGQALARLALGVLGRLTRDWREPLPPLTPGDPTIRRILVVRMDLLGDVVLSTAAVRALRRGYPQATIDMLVPKSSAPILLGNPDIQRVLTFNPGHLIPTRWLFLPAARREVRDFLRATRTPGYDLAVSVNGDIGSIVTRLTGARRRVGYAGEAYPYFMTDSLPGRRYDKPEHEVQYILALAQAAGGVVMPEDAHPRLALDPQAQKHIAEVIAVERTQTSAQGPVVTLHAGARNGQAKRWPTRYSAALVDLLIERLDALVVLTGAPNEESLAAEVMSQLRNQRRPALNLCGKTSLPELAALLAASDVAVSGDSGPMHIACAVGAPVVVLHGPTDPGQSGPTDPDAIVLWNKVWCAPCYDPSATAECRFGNPVCMKGITPGMAFAAVRRQLTNRQQ